MNDASRMYLRSRLHPKAAEEPTKGTKSIRVLRLCFSCAERLKAGYTLRATAVQDKLTKCPECGQRKYCNEYEVGKRGAEHED